MRCLYCGKKLSLLHKISGKEFCGNEHYELYLQDQESLGLARLIEARKAARSRQRRDSAKRGGPPLADLFFPFPPASRDCPPRIRTCFTDPHPTLAVALPQAEMSLGPCRIPQPKPSLDIHLPAALGEDPRRLEASFTPPLMRARIPAHTPGLAHRSAKLPAPGWIPPAVEAPFPPALSRVPPAEPAAGAAGVPEPPGQVLPQPPAAPPAGPAPMIMPGRSAEAPKTSPRVIAITTGKPEVPAPVVGSGWALVRGGWKILEQVTAGFVPIRMEALAGDRPAQPPPSCPEEPTPLAPITGPAPRAAGVPCHLASEGPRIGPLFESSATAPAPATPDPAIPTQCPLAAPAAPPQLGELVLPEAGLEIVEPAAVPGAARPLAYAPQPLASKPFLVPPTVRPRLASGLGSGSPRPAALDAAPSPGPSPAPPPAACLALFRLALPSADVEIPGPRSTACPSRGAIHSAGGPDVDAPVSTVPEPLPHPASSPAPPEVPPAAFLPPPSTFVAAPAGPTPPELPGVPPAAPAPPLFQWGGGAAAAALPGPPPGPKPWAGRQPELVPLGTAHIVPPSGHGLQASRAEWIGEAPKPLLRRPNRIPVADEFEPRTTPDAARRRPRPQVGLWLQRTWYRVPGRLKWAVMSLPLALLLVQQIGLQQRPTEVAAAAAEESGSFSQFLQARWENLRTNIMNRAAISLTDDFRSGLGSWTGEANWGRTWSYDKAGFILPGALALYEPSLNLVDYEFVLAARIERGGVSWVFRARDTRNYYAGRLVITQPGPLPKARLVNYTVIDGRRKSQKSTEVPFPLRDKMYQIRVAVRGSTFTTYLDDRVVGLYKDDTLKTGGVGLFRARGEKARVRWISVMHQYDLVGRLCALIAPYNLERPPGGWSE